MKSIYIWTNEVSGKRYVGRTNNIRGSRVFSHTREGAKGLLAKDIKRIGLSVFSIRVFPYPNFTKKELAEKERDWILALGTLEPNGYNKILPNPKRKKQSK